MTKRNNNETEAQLKRNQFANCLPILDPNLTPVSPSQKYDFGLVIDGKAQYIETEAQPAPKAKKSILAALFQTLVWLAVLMIETLAAVETKFRNRVHVCLLSTSVMLTLVKLAITESFDRPKFLSVAL